MDYVTIKVYEETRLHLRVIAAITGEQMVQVLERLCRTEAERVMPKEGLLVIHTRKRKGKSIYVEGIAIDQFPDQPGTGGDDPHRDTGDGGAVAGDNAV